jgi:D-hexose-6-phosphate mutarotase
MHGNAGRVQVTLKGTDGSVAEIYPFGGVVTSWVKDGRDVLYVRPDAKFDKSKPISGGIPHCWPQFGPGESWTPRPGRCAVQHPPQLLPPIRSGRTQVMVILQLTSLAAHTRRTQATCRCTGSRGTWTGR